MIWKLPHARRQGFRICCSEPLEIRLNLSSQVPVIQPDVHVAEPTESPEFEAVEVQLEQAYESGQVVQIHSDQIPLLDEVMAHVADDLSVSMGELRQLVLLPARGNVTRSPAVAQQSTNDFLSGDMQTLLAPSRVSDSISEISFSEAAKSGDSAAAATATLERRPSVSPEAPPDPPGTPQHSLSTRRIDRDPVQPAVEPLSGGDKSSNSELVEIAQLPQPELEILYGGAPDLLNQEIQLRRQTPQAAGIAEPNSPIGLVGVSHPGHSILTTAVLAGGLFTVSTADRPFGVVGIAKRMHREIGRR